MEASITADQAADLKGQALDDALDAHDLSKSGTVEEKRQRLVAVGVGAPRGDTVVLRPGYPITSFDPRVPGVPVLYQEGTAVNAKLEDAVRRAAAAADVRVERV